MAFAQHRVKVLGQIVDHTGVRQVSAIVNFKTMCGRCSPSTRHDKPTREVLTSPSCQTSLSPIHLESSCRRTTTGTVNLNRRPSRRFVTRSAPDLYLHFSTRANQPRCQWMRHPSDFEPFSYNGERRPVAYASRSMTPTEQRYAQTEKRPWQSLGHMTDSLTTLWDFDFM